MVNINIIEQVGKGKATFYVLSGRLPDQLNESEMP